MYGANYEKLFSDKTGEVNLEEVVDAIFDSISMFHLK